MGERGGRERLELGSPHDTDRLNPAGWVTFVILPRAFLSRHHVIQG
jgi:hypothetical protein